MAKPVASPAATASPVTPQLVEAALAGDRRAMTTLVAAMLPPIKVEAARHLGRQARIRGRDPRQDVDDFAHETVLHLLHGDGRLLRMWDPARGHSLSSFVRMITRQRISRILQGHRHNPWSDVPTDQESLEPLVEHEDGRRVLESREELRGLLERLRAHMDERALLLFQRIYVEQQPIVEVAAELKMTREAVDAWNSRLRQLARRLAREAGKEGR